MEPDKYQIVKPDPYFEINFRCSNRKFYGVKNIIWDIGESIGIEPQDGYFDEQCDYEGDLERIIIYNGERGKDFVSAVLKYYEITIDIQGLNIELTC